MPDAENLLDLLRGRLGVESLDVLREDTPLRDKAYRDVERAYVEWRQPLPPAKRADELRPIFAPSALSPTYEVAQSLQSLLLAHSVAIIVPNSINYIPRLVWLLTLLESAIDARLVHIVSEETVGRETEFFDVWMEEQTVGVKGETKEARLKAAQLMLETGDIALALDACSRHPEYFDLACRTPGQLEWLRHHIEEVPGTASA
jgi:hypothetical protein